jgi:hypothetical protein
MTTEDIGDARHRLTAGIMLQRSALSSRGAQKPYQTGC